MKKRKARNNKLEVMVMVEKSAVVPFSENEIKRIIMKLKRLGVKKSLIAKATIMKNQINLTREFRRNYERA